MSIVARADGAWRLIDCKENSGIYVRDAGEWVSLCPPGPTSPFELITGYTIKHVGTSASLVGGQVTFTDVTELSLNDVFKHPDDGGFRNYVVHVQAIGSAATVSVDLRYRDGSDDAQGSDYVRQQLRAPATSVAGDRPAAATSARQMHSSDTHNSAVKIHVYGPALPQPTASRSVSVMGRNGGRIYDEAITHSQPVSYDGFTLMVLSSETVTGTLSVYGVRS